MTTRTKETRSDAALVKQLERQIRENARREAERQRRAGAKPWTPKHAAGSAKAES